MIIAEALWTPGLRERLQGRVHRIPQSGVVHIYEAVAPDSDIDMALKDAVMKKVELKHNLMAP